MYDGYNNIQYVLPENSKISFTISPQTRFVSLELLDGTAEISVKGSKIQLPLQLEFLMAIWECLESRLKAKTACNLLVHGDHYGCFSVQKGHVVNTLVSIFPVDNSYSFVLEKSIQLEIFPIQYTEEEPAITIKSTRGALEIFGYKLSPNATYSLSPYSPVLLQSSNDEPYSVYIQGLDRKVKLSELDENYRRCVNAVTDHILNQILFLMSPNKFKHSRPTILVLGQKNVGKSSFCQQLVNEALENKITPTYVDLNVKRNSSLPGSLSLSEINGRVDSTLDYSYSFRTLLHYGSVILHPITLPLYNYLLRKVAGLLASPPEDSCETTRISVIDTDGYQGEDNKAIEFILSTFTVDFIVYIGDRRGYENLKPSIRVVPSKFIPKLHNIEILSNDYESKYCQYRIEKYFCCSAAEPSTRNVCTVRLDCFTIYRILSYSVYSVAKDKNVEKFKIEPMLFNTNMLSRLLAVSASNRVELPSLTNIKYYVCFTRFDPFSNLVTVMAPEFERFTGGMLLMGHVLRLKKSDEIILTENV